MEQQIEEEITVQLDAAVSTLNGKESWESFTLREPAFAEVSVFYRESRKTSEHDAMAALISVISGINLTAVKKLPIRKFREAQAYLLDFLNWFPTREPVFEEEITVQLDAAVSTLNGKESWESFTLREPAFAEVSDFYRESRKTSEHDAMAALISVISGVNLMAVKKLPIRKFREAQAYLLGFLNWFPTREPGGNA